MFAIGQQKSKWVHGRVRFPDGAWRQQTSGCTDSKEAEDVFVTMQYFVNQSNKPHNRSRQAMLALMRKVYAEKFDEDCPLLLTEDFLARFCQTSKHYVAGSTQAQLAKTAEWYAKFLQQEGLSGCLLEGNSPPIIKRFGAYLVERGKHSVAGANTRLEKLATIFGAAVAEGLLKENPVRKVRLKDRSAETERDADEEIHQPYTKGHLYAGIDRLVEGCNPEMLVDHLLSVDLGARGGDVAALNRGMFVRSPEVAKNYFRYYARKAKHWHKVYPFEPTVGLLHEYLDYHLVDQSPDALLFPSFGYPTGPEVPDGEFNRHSAVALNCFGMYLDALAIRVRLNPEGEGRARYSHASHSGRVTCVTMCAQANIPESVTCARVLHHGREVHQIYQKHSPEAVQRSITGTCNDAGVVNITLAEFKEAVVYATERLRSLRGKLDLHDGTLSAGDKTRRASLIPVPNLPA